MTGPQLFGERYQLGETLGFGGMSEVHRGRDLRLGRDVAIKVLRADLARDPSFQNRFRREAQNAASLNHPAIVAVYDTGESRGETGENGEKLVVPYIVMEYVDGETLRDMVKRDGALQPRRAMEIMADVCAALDFSHRHGIVHRDVKPANVMLTRGGAVKVMDFGIARALGDGASTQTATAAVIGTAQYLSPEQARGETVDARSDVYAAGCVLYELLTGTPPFVGDSPVAIAYQHVREDAKPPSEVNTDLPPALDAIVLKALNKNPLNRYQTSAEMRSDLVRALSGQAVHATPVMSDDERTELMRATPARTPATGSLLAPPSRTAAVAEPIEDDSKRAKKIWGRVGVGALLLAVLGAAIWVTINITKQPDKAAELPVPNVVGLTYDDAVAKLRESGFSADPTTVSAEVADDQIGKVQSQNPSAATIRPTTDLVKLTVGVSQSLVKVPNVIGKSQADAQQILTDAKLNPVFTTATSAATDKDRAFQQDPPDGTDVKPGTTVNVVIGTGVAVIPVPDFASLVGQPVDQVTATLKGQGFEVFQASTPSSAPANQVIAITGGNPGEQVQVGTILTVNFSDNTLFKVPNIIGQSESSANAALIAAGWADGNAVQVTRVSTSNPAQYNRVMSQDPKDGGDYAKNGVVKVTIGVPQQITIPNMVGQTVDGARGLLAGAGFTGTIATTSSQGAPEQVGKVVGQDPGAGASVPANSTVTLNVGAAAPPTAPTS